MAPISAVSSSCTVEPVELCGMETTKPATSVAAASSSITAAASLLLAPVIFRSTYLAVVSSATCQSPVVFLRF